MGKRLTLNQHKKNKNLKKNNFPIELKINNNNIWCNEIYDSNNENKKFITSKGYILFVINNLPGSGLSTLSDYTKTDSIIKNTELIKKICANKEIYLNYTIELVKEGSFVKISEIDGIESWKICKYNDMYQNMGFVRGNRYFIA